MSFNDWSRKRAKENRFSQHASFLPSQYPDCFRRALSRMSFLLNCDTGKVKNAQVSLEDSDIDLAAYLDSARITHSLWALSCSDFKDETVAKLAMAKEDEANDHFYGFFNIRRRRRKTDYLKITLQIPELFVDLSYDGFHMPRYPRKEMNLEGLNDPEFEMRCATNYLLRNFWHNFIHEVFHNTTHLNYHLFSGSARDESDFEADNLSYLLLAKSYGLPVISDGNIKPEQSQSIVRMLRMNRCNDVFRRRASLRQSREKDKNPKDIAQLLEYEWRVRRSLSGYIAGWFLTAGFALTDIKVHFVGDIEYSKKSGIVRKLDGVVFALNRAHFSYRPTGNTVSSIDRDVYKSISQWLEIEYRNFMNDNLHYRDSVSNYLSTFCQRISIPN